MPVLRLISIPPKSEARLTPVLANPHGTLSRQAGFLGIIANVSNDPIEMLGIPDNRIVTLLLPQSPPAADSFVDLSSRVSFPAFRDRIEFMARQRSHDDVHMVGHHRTGAEMEALAVEFRQGAHDPTGVLRLCEPAFPVTPIQPLFLSPGDQLGILAPVLIGSGFWMFPFPGGFGSGDFTEAHRGQGVSQPKGHKIRRSVLTPVRQIPAINSDWPPGIEPLKSRRRIEQKLAESHDKSCRSTGIPACGGKRKNIGSQITGKNACATPRPTPLRIRRGWLGHLDFRLPARRMSWVTAFRVYRPPLP